MLASVSPCSVAPACKTQFSSLQNEYKWPVPYKCYEDEWDNANIFIGEPENLNKGVE